MEEQSNQVVPSTSCDWLDRFDDEGSNNQVVPARLPRSTVTEALNLETTEPEPLLQPTTLPLVGEHLLNPGSVPAIEDSLKELSLEGMQVVPSASRIATVDSLKMDVEPLVELQTMTRKLIRSASKNNASKA